MSWTPTHLMYNDLYLYSNTSFSTFAGGGYHGTPLKTRAIAAYFTRLNVSMPNNTATMLATMDSNCNLSPATVAASALSVAALTRLNRLGILGEHQLSAVGKLYLVATTLA